VLGHHRLFLALARALVKDQDVYRLLFSPAERSRESFRAPAQALAGRNQDAAVERAGHVVPHCSNDLPRLDKIVVCGQDDALAPQ
jgi:hypothetical protein